MTARRRARSLARRAASLLAVALSLAVADRAAADSEADASLRPGRTIYREGVLPSGAPLVAVVRGDIRVEGASLACVGCHQRSGLGSSEGGKVAPAITAAALYQPRQPGSRQAYRSKSPGAESRPAYDETTLASAIRHGFDPAGRELDPLMPRYQLSEPAMAALLAYLGSLARSPVPGVDEAEIHLATVVSRGVDPDRRRAMLELIEAWVRAKNGESRGESRRAKRGAWYKQWEYSAFRRWKLHVWQLGDDPAGWRRELEQYNAEQPVFALLAGLVAGDWRPIHDFCEERRVPCVLPNTDLPVTEGPNFYTIYFSKGLVLEAEALALHLAGPAAEPRAAVVQVYRRESPGAVAAAALRAARIRRGSGAPQERVLGPDEPVPPDLLRRLGQRTSAPAANLVLWLGAADLGRLAGPSPPAMRVFVSSSLLGGAPPALDLLPDLGDRLFAIHPFGDPAGKARRLLRARAWLKVRGVEARDERLQADTFAAVELTWAGIKHLRNNFSREYFLEGLEHTTDNAVFTSLYPHLSLGPGQRFASKGCWVLGRDPAVPGEHAGGWRPLGERLIP